MSTKLEISEWLGARLTAGAFSEYAKRNGGDEPTPEPNGEAAAIVIQPAAFAVEPAMKMHGRPDRVVNGTEPLSGRSASQGTELCATAEHILSAQVALETLGYAGIADDMEVAAYNTLPATLSPDGKGDVVDLSFPSKPVVTHWKDDSIAVMRGPLLYALKIEAAEKARNAADWPAVVKDANGVLRDGELGFPMKELRARSPWNYALVASLGPDGEQTRAEWFRRGGMTRPSWRFSGWRSWIVV